MVTLYSTRGKRTIIKSFDSISNAYNFYVKNLSKSSEWIYYLKVAHTFLNQVTDEKIMLAIFENVFDEKTHLTIDKKEG